MPVSSKEPRFRGPEEAEFVEAWQVLVREWDSAQAELQKIQSMARLDAAAAEAAAARLDRIKARMNALISASRRKRPSSEDGLVYGVLKRKSS